MFVFIAHCYKSKNFIFAIFSFSWILISLEYKSSKRAYFVIAPVFILFDNRYNNITRVCVYQNNENSVMPFDII